MKARILAYFFSLLLLSGCASSTAFHKVVHVPAHNVHIVSDRSLFDSWQARDERSGIAGYADGSSIWILGYQADGKIFIRREAVEWLGHEVWEHMRINDKQIGNPHDKQFWMP